MASELFENNSMLGNITDPESTIKHISATAYAGGAMRTFNRWIVLTLLVLGGVDTTHGAVSTAILAMVLNPAVQQKAQAEIDRVVGRDRLPDWSDRESLPYVGAVCREVLRWRPIVPLGLHMILSVWSDIYPSSLQVCSVQQPKMMYTKECLFRKVRTHFPSALRDRAWLSNCTSSKAPSFGQIFGEIFYPAVPIDSNSIGDLRRAMTRNETLYPNPEDFKPERFLLQDGSLNNHDPTTVFGFGRRLVIL